MSCFVVVERCILHALRELSHRQEYDEIRRLLGRLLNSQLRFRP